MTAVPSYFNDFLSATRLGAALRNTCSAKHLELRQLLRDDPALAAIIIDAFLQGSYRRDTIVRPLDPTDPTAHVDVDLVVVTTLDPEQNSPDSVVARFTPFLDRNFPNHWRPNDRSIQLTYEGTPVTLDLVVTAAPSEVIREAVIKAAELAGRRVNGLPTLSSRALPFESDILSLRQSVAKSAQLSEGDGWKEDYLLIPDRQLRRWEPTHPIEQIAWTQRKNASTSGHYINVVKAVKWWRLRNNVPKHPKGYPLEHCVGTVCPDGISSVGEGVTRSLEGIVNAFEQDVLQGTKPELQDHGVAHDVFSRVTPAEFGQFYRLVGSAALLARQALNAPTTAESATGWRELLGPEFPKPTPGGFTQRTAASTIATGGRFG